MTLNAISRPEEITTRYSMLIDQHLKDLVEGRIDKMYEIEDFAELLNIHPVHLSGTIKAFTGQSPCGIYQPKILAVAKGLLAQGHRIRSVAFTLTFEPSQFTKWFKRLSGQTPRGYCRSLNQDHFPV